MPQLERHRRLRGPQRRPAAAPLLQLGCWRSSRRAAMGGALDADSSGGRHTRAHGAVRLPSGPEGSLPGCKLRLAEVLSAAWRGCWPGVQDEAPQSTCKCSHTPPRMPRERIDQINTNQHARNVIRRQGGDNQWNRPYGIRPSSPPGPAPKPSPSRIGSSRRSSVWRCSSPPTTSYCHRVRRPSPRLGFPAGYFLHGVVVGQVRRAAALLVPMVPARLKEWAYAGFAINLVSALITHLSLHQGPQSWGPSAITSVFWGAPRTSLAPPRGHAGQAPDRAPPNV